jgi:hypothetical protein
LYILDLNNSRVRRIDLTGTITTFAGNGAQGHSGDGGLATNAAIDPKALALDQFGNLYISEAKYVRKVTGDGMIRTIAGNAQDVISCARDGMPPLAATFGSLGGITVDADGNVFIADAPCHRVFAFSPGGTIRTFAGNGSYGYSGDGGPATRAGFQNLRKLTVDQVGNLYIGDDFRIRRVTRDGLISTYGGNGDSATKEDVPALASGMLAPSGMTFDAYGNLLFVDAGNGRVRVITADRQIHTIAGNGGRGFSGDGGLATAAQLQLANLMFPFDGGVAVDSTGNVYLTDSLNDRIRKVVPNPISQLTPTVLQFVGTSGGAPTAAQSLSFGSSVAGLAFSANVGVGWLAVKPQAGAAPQLIDVVADPSGLAPGVYQTTLKISSPYAKPESTAVTVTFTVTPGPAPARRSPGRVDRFRSLESSPPRAKG